MKEIGGFRFVSYTALAILFLPLGQCRNTSYTSPSAQHLDSEALGSDFVTFENKPTEVIDGYNLSVQYLCSRPCVLGVEVLASTERTVGALVFRRRWTSGRELGVPRTRLLRLQFPPAMAYRRDFFIRRSVDNPGVILRAWLDHRGRLDVSGDNGSAYHGALRRTFALLETLPPSDRPSKQHGRCPSWGAEQVWKLSQNRVSQCPLESEVTELLRFPLASTGETFGVVRQFQPFISKELERARHQAMMEPRVAMSVWIYLLSWCGSKLCAIVQHVDGDNLFDTPLLLLTKTGDLLFQVRLASGEDGAFRAHAALPLRTWHRLDCFMEGPKVTLRVKSLMTSEKTVEREYKFNFQSDVHYNDTSGYFVIGGSRFLPTFQGYFGPIRYHRLGTDEVTNPLWPAGTLEELDRTHRACEEIQAAAEAFSRALRESEEIAERRVCRSYYAGLRSRHGGLAYTVLPESWNTTGPYRLLPSLLQLYWTTEQDFHFGSWDKDTNLHFGRWVFEKVMEELSGRGNPGLSAVSPLVPLLQVSSCCGHHVASMLLAVVHLAGVGVAVDTRQGHVYSLIGAQADHRLSLMHLGYKHSQGLDAFPKDHDVAYSYYSNVGRQTCVDRHEVQDTQQYTTEYIHLTDEGALRGQTDEGKDVFQFLKFQAERGDLESQKALARMLFWGQNGVSKDVGSALKWYAESAMKMTDPRAMYDYSILLLRGQGVKKNRTLGRQLMEKAAAMGNLEALNGMGWYYSTFMVDNATAVKFFEQAALNGSKDAIYNLGVFHLNGHYPGKPGKNQTAAFQHFQRAAASGHMDASVETAWYLASGNLPDVPRQPETAVLLLKRVCDDNGYLGYVLRKAVNAYLQGSREESLLSYLLAAETGLGVAQNNAGHLCEELGLPYTCGLRYYNYSTYNLFPHPSGFLKMGDYFYHGHGNQSQNVALSMLMYTRAALARSPQGIFNLAAMIEAGLDVPDKNLEDLNITKLDQTDRRVVLEKLYQRCRELEDMEDLSPCSLALFKLHLGGAWRKLIQDPVYSALVYVVGSIVITSLLSIVIQRITGAITAQVLQGRGTDSEGAPNRVLARRDQADAVGWLDAVAERSGRLAGIPGRGCRAQPAGEWAVTLSGVCLCAMGSVLLSQLL